MSGVDCQMCARDEIAPFYVRFPAAAARRYAESLSRRGELARGRRLERNDRLLEERRLGADVAQRRASLDAFVAKVGGAGASEPLRGKPRKCAWTKADDELIRLHYAKRGAVWCSRRIGRTISACRVRAGKLGVSASARPKDASPWRAWKPTPAVAAAAQRPKAPPKGNVCPGRRRRSDAWSERDIEYLEKHYAKRGAIVCGRQLNRSAYAVRVRAAQMGLRILARWTEAEDRVIRAFAGRGQQAIFERLEKMRGTPARTRAAIRRRARALGISFATAYVRWTPREDAILVRHYATDSVEKIVARLGGKRTPAAIVTRACELRRRAR